MAWTKSHRVIAGAVLLLLLGIGFYGYWPFIVDDWPRLDDWQRVAIWVGDFTAVALMVQWIFGGTHDAVGSEFNTRAERNDAIRKLRWISLSLLMSLSVDIGITVYGIYVENLASQRSVPANAEVIGLQAIDWRPVRHFKLAIEFNDANGNRHQGLLVFTQKREGFPDWVDLGTRQAIENGLRQFPIAIRYDPHRPPRVWAAAEPWQRGQALAYAFLVIHFFQAIIVVAAVFGTWFVRDYRPTPVALQIMPILALAVESCALAFWGTLFRLRGF